MSRMKLTAEQITELRDRPIGATGNRLAAAIEIAGVVQASMADTLGLSQQYVSDVARGRYKGITVENGHKFAEYFGCDIKLLFPPREAVA